jgi:predicted alpha-1,2-mannosidase
MTFVRFPIPLLALVPTGAVAGLAVLTSAACSSSSSPSAAPASDAGLQDLAPTRPAETPVSPLFIGSGGFGYGTGSGFPGATAPQGIAKLGPDTSGPWGTINFLHCSGYWYGDNVIQGFSHMHLHGTGVPDYGVLGIMPVPSFDASMTTMTGYQSNFDKSSESAVPGKYTVTLQNGSILVEMTATPHAGHHRYTYPSSATTAHVVLDLDHHISSGTVDTETVTLDPSASTLSGSFVSKGGLSAGFGGSPIYFFATTAKPWTQAQVWSSGSMPAAGTTAQGTGVGVDLDFDVSDHTPVEIQVGLSFVSTANAAANLAAEMPSFAFDAEAAATAAAWKQATSVVQVEGGTAAQQAMMQAAVYHLFLMPSIQSDVDGSYVGVDRQVHMAQGFHYVSELSLWDIYRTFAPLMNLVDPARSLDTVQSLIAMSQQEGFFPKWPIGDGEAGTMIGASAEVVIADAYVKGLRGFDAEGAYQTMRAAAMDTATPQGGRGGMDQVVPYMQLGYVPAVTNSASSTVSLTIEYGQDDAALAQLATALGHTSDATTLQARLHGWQKLYDPVTGLLWAKNATGGWASPHGDGTGFGGDFDEATADQSLWGPWYDMPTLESVLGGKAALVTKLEAFFENGKSYYDAIKWSDPLSVGAVPPYYWGGNEPDIHTPWIFALAGRPDLTQKWLPWVESEIYTAGDDGLPGNDDAGTMSALLVMAMLGFYDIPGTDQYIVGAPAFTKATITVSGGTFTIEAPAVSATNVYVQSVMLNGKPLTTPIFHHSDFKPGGTLAFVMGPEPSSWGQ